MKAFKIDAVNKTVTEIELEEGKTLRGMQAVVGGTITTAVILENEDTVFVHDEGLYLFPDFFFIEGNGQPNAGNGIVTGCNANGKTVGVQSTLEEIRSRVRFLDKAQALELAEELGC